MKVLAADGLGFSVPIDAVSKIIEHFKTNGYMFHFKQLIILTNGYMFHFKQPIILSVA